MSCNTLRPAGKYVVLFWAPHGDKYRYVRCHPPALSSLRQPTPPTLPRTHRQRVQRPPLPSYTSPTCLPVAGPPPCYCSGRWRRRSPVKGETQARIPAPGRSLDSRYPLRIRHAVISSAAAERCANTCSGGLAANHTPPTLTVKTPHTALRPHVRRPPPTSLRSPRVCLSLRSLSSLAWELLGESA